MISHCSDDLKEVAFPMIALLNRFTQVQSIRLSKAIFDVIGLVIENLFTNEIKNIIGVCQ